MFWITIIRDWSYGLTIQNLTLAFAKLWSCKDELSDFCQNQKCVNVSFYGFMKQFFSTPLVHFTKIYTFTIKSILQSPQFGRYPTFSKIAQFQIKRMDILLCWLMWTKGSWGNGEILMFSSFDYLIRLFVNKNGWK